MKEVAGFSKVSLVGYGWLSFSVLALNYVAIFHPHLWVTILSEDRLVENLTAGFFFLSSIGLFMVAFVNRDTWRWLAFIFAGLVMVFVAGEEISWGQRIFGFESPEWFKTENYNREINLHNLGGFSNEEMLLVITLVCACVSFSAQFSNRVKLFGIPCPSIPLAFGLLIVVSYRSWLLPGNAVDVLFGVTNKYILLIFLLTCISFRSSLSKDKRLVWIACATVALILSNEYAGYVQYHATHTSGFNRTPWRHIEIREYILGLICLLYSIELLNSSRQATELTSQQSIEKTRWASGGGVWLLVCSVVTGSSVGLVLVGQLYTAHIKNAITDRFYSEVAPSGPVALSVFDVYATEHQLTYHKQPCTIADIESGFFLHVVPVEERDLPEDMRSRGSINYSFNILGVIGDGCIKVVDLPDYEIAGIRTGQYTKGVWSEIWAAEISFPPVSIEDELARFYSEVAPSGPVALSVFDVYATEDQLTYHKQPCTIADIENNFFLHVIPGKEQDLPENERPSGFDNFRFKINGVLGDGCIKVVDLPDYEIAGVRTGQFTDEEQIWAVEISFPPVSIEDELARFYSEVAPSGPVALSVFDVYATEDQLTYHKQPCTIADIENNFFLHVTPDEEQDLPEDRRSLGFDNYDFRINGTTRDNSCVKTVDLPDYKIASIRTGQFTDEEQIWAVEIPFPARIAVGSPEPTGEAR